MAPIWGEWTDWQWDQAQARYWRARRDTQGNIEYDFNFPAPSGQAAPRDTAGDLADALGSVNISGRDATYTQEGAYTYGGSGAAGGAATTAVYAASSSNPPIVVSSIRKPKAVVPPSKSRSKSHRDGYKENKDKSKKHRSKPEKSLADDVPETLPADDPNLRPFYGSGDPSNAEPGSVPASSTAYPTRQDPAYKASSLNEESPMEPRRATQDTAQVFPQSQAQIRAMIQRQQTAPILKSNVMSRVDAPVAVKRLLPRLGIPDLSRKTRPAASKAPNNELHDAISQADAFMTAFVVEHSTRFQPGMVFKIEWCEPLGAAPLRSEVITNPVRMEQDGMQFYQGVRRFIVVANDEGHCACVPILTYGHKACTKRGVKPLKHGIVYQSGKRPRMVDNEPSLGFRPIAVDLYERTEKLDKESRVNYAKITTVEHNFRVFFIGCVTQADFHNIVKPAVDHCWGKKKR
ncbi:hypothetical protein N0V88_002241 [Collariella sp. IMI 366227]|nr:hypothetical protein N0V88_002241 [Collariella sp. IMI 366227]